MNPHVTFRRLQVFESVARRLSYTRAAEELHLTQLAVSMQVKQLEHVFGHKLFRPHRPSRIDSDSQALVRGAPRRQTVVLK